MHRQIIVQEGLKMGTSENRHFEFSLHNITTSVTDIDASVEWWTRIFGLKEVARSRFEAIGAEVAFMEGPGFRLELLQPSDGFQLPELTADPPGHVQLIGNKALVFKVDDLSAVTETFRDLGVTIVWEMLDLGDGSVSTAIRDNDGNFINVFQAGASPVG
ncbi:VOC family protein [Streptomyces sp. NPDC001422]|uniref:VOC family protein n=1 Tax=Streptomyces sp. NPDC001422 TaxID=3364575 RepID=UPI003680045B